MRRIWVIYCNPGTPFEQVWDTVYTCREDAERLLHEVHGLRQHEHGMVEFAETSEP